MRNHRLRPLPPIALAPGFHRDLVYWDLLHVLYLGVGQDWASAAIWKLQQRGFFASVGQALEMWRNWLHQNRMPQTSLDDLTMGSLGVSPTSFPDLPGKAVPLNCETKNIRAHTHNYVCSHGARKQTSAQTNVSPN